MKYLLKKSLLLITSLALSLPALSSLITVDGIKTVGEYTGASPSSGQIDLPWWNGHNSIYTKAAGNTNPLYWEINDNSSSFSLNLFFEVPTYARRMIWEKDCDYGGKGGCTTIDTEYLDAYKEGSHHDSVKMNYKTQTGNEYFELKNGDKKKDSIVKIKWQS